MPRQLHELKCIPPHFQHVVDGTKRFEVRLNDRDYQLGDLLDLQEYVPATEAFTGRSCLTMVTYVLKGGQYGIHDAYVVLGIKVIDDSNTMATESVLLAITRNT
jgi:hypothetical protein